MGVLGVKLGNPRLVGSELEIGGDVPLGVRRLPLVVREFVVGRKCSYHDRVREIALEVSSDIERRTNPTVTLTHRTDAVVHRGSVC